MVYDIAFVNWSKSALRVCFGENSILSSYNPKVILRTNGFDKFSRPSYRSLSRNIVGAERRGKRTSYNNEFVKLSSNLRMDRRKLVVYSDFARNGPKVNIRKDIFWSRLYIMNIKSAIEDWGWKLLKNLACMEKKKGFCVSKIGISWNCYEGTRMKRWIFDMDMFFMWGRECLKFELSSLHCQEERKWIRSPKKARF